MFEQVCGIMRRTFSQPGLVITRATSASDVPGWDSLNHLFLAMEIEAGLNVEVSAEEIAALPNVGSLCDLIEARRK
nr:acyl carrier protein [Plastoroseomonas hellenica]